MSGEGHTPNEAVIKLVRRDFEAARNRFRIDTQTALDVFPSELENDEKRAKNDLGGSLPQELSNDIAEARRIAGEIRAKFAELDGLFKSDSPEEPTEE